MVREDRTIMRAIIQAGIPVFSDAVGVSDSRAVAKSGVGLGAGVKVDSGVGEGLGTAWASRSELV